MASLQIFPNVSGTCFGNLFVVKLVSENLFGKLFVLKLVSGSCFGNLFWKLVCAQTSFGNLFRKLVCAQTCFGYLLWTEQQQSRRRAGASLRGIRFSLLIRVSDPGIQKQH